ncbi:MAG: hypothetical protein KDA20_09410 [Phycisphaerales bacterium]|nr:hypothetical protein [Phycisphaerales bacterium]
MGLAIHVVIPTHLPRYLDLVLAGLARQTRRADTVLVSCDTDDPAIGEVIEQCARIMSMPIWWVRRPAQEGERLCQVRNNGVRALLEHAGARATSDQRLLILDGDMLAPEGLVAAHLECAADLVYPYRIEVGEARSKEINAARIFERGLELSPSNAEMDKLRARDRRYRKHLLMRRLHFGPLHKPKLLGGHFSTHMDLYDQLNGFDELYRGWGFKDDEFAYRAAKIGARARAACAAIPAWHLYHTTRQAGVRMADLPTAQRFAQRGRLPTICEHGLRNCLTQPMPEVQRFGA